MLVQAGVTNYGVTTDKPITFKLGTNPFIATLEPPANPIKEEDPMWPKTAKMLSISSALIAISLIIF
jgi:hypothetical protein